MRHFYYGYGSCVLLLFGGREGVCAERTEHPRVQGASSRSSNASTWSSPTSNMLLLLLFTDGQLRGHQSVEHHPSLIVHMCTLAGGCIPTRKSVVMDSNWRWIHKVNSSENCYDNNEWDKTACPDVATCSKNCAIEGIAADKYNGTYGVHTDGEELRLDFVSPTGNVGSRLYLLDNASTYQSFHLNNREFAFDVDVSSLPCGVNGAVYFVQMDADGGKKRFAGKNEAGGVRHWLLRCTVSERCQVYQRRAEHARLGPIPGGAQLGRGQVRLVLRGARCVGSKQPRDRLHRASVQHGARRSAAVREPARLRRGAHRYDSLCDKDGCDVHTYRLGAKEFYGAGASFLSTRRSRSPSSLNSSRRTAPTRHRSSRYAATTGRAASRFQRRAPPSGPAGHFRLALGRVLRRGDDALRLQHDVCREGRPRHDVLQRPRDGPRPLSMGRLPRTCSARLDRPARLDQNLARRGALPHRPGRSAKIEPGSKAYALFSNIRFGEIGSTDTVFPPAPRCRPLRRRHSARSPICTVWRRRFRQAMARADVLPVGLPLHG